MQRMSWLLVVAAVLAGGLTYADEEVQVLKVDKAFGAEVLASLGFLYLTGLGDSYLVQGDPPAVGRLDEAGVAFETVTSLRPGDEVYLLRARTLNDEDLYSGYLIGLGGRHYLATLPTHRIEELRLLPYSKVRLLPGAFPRADHRALVQWLAAVTPRPEIESMIGGVSGDTLWTYISQLSGREPAPVGGGYVSIPTRYSYSPMIDTAAQYLYEHFAACGIDVDYHYYTVGKYSFYSTDFVDPFNGWVVGSDQRVFRTRDGGLTWVRQKPGALFQSFWGVCFLDTLRGWIAGTDGRIYNTTDGGTSWTQQTTPASVTLREIVMLDSLTGWTVGYGGIIFNTTDGGTTWSTVSSGTTKDLYGAHFQASDRGWACGMDGTLLFWDGVSWTPQTSGTVEYLLDMHFGDDNTGWAVGGGSTILRTSDAGQNWTAQSAPSGIDPYLKGVCFTDTLNGWAVGLSGTIIHTGDGGSNWEVQSSETLFGLRWVRFINNLEGWIAGYGGTIHHTADGGASWESQRENLPAGALLAWRNVVATKPGAVTDDQVIICGHFDSTSEDPNNLAPGADDNATGTAAVIEAARIVAEYPFEKTIKFLCVSGEEQGLFGSGEYATDAKFAGEVITGVLNFDMIGYVNSTPEDIDLIGNPASEWLVDFTVDCAAAYVPDLPTLKVINENEVYSDHASFWRAGYHAFEGIEDDNLTYPHYHTTNDTLGNLTQSFTTNVVKLGIATLAELAVPDLTSGVAASGRVASAVTATPNPFSAAARISFMLGAPERVRVSVFDVEGRLVRILHEGTLGAGQHELIWRGYDAHGHRAAPGIYFAGVRTREIDESVKMILLK